jgi:hypothetical protein
MRAPTQNDRLLLALERDRRRGITQVDFLLPDVIDGGAPITRVAARINDLRDRGHRIDTRGERDSCVIYVLAEPAAVPSWQPAPTPVASGSAEGALF